MKPVALIIDDEVQIRRLLRVVLEGENYQVHEAETGQQGLMEIASRRPAIILLDLGLPDLDGLDVLKRLREWSEAPVLVLSVRDDEAEKVAALDAGAEDYVTKPFSTPELLARVRAAQRKTRCATRLAIALTGKTATAELLAAEDPQAQVPTLLGTLALRTGKVMKWDAKGLKAANVPEAQPFIEGRYRKGWELPV